MKKTGKILAWGMLVGTSAGLLMSGCKSAPPLTREQAQAMIQAKYDQTLATGAAIVIDSQGLDEGVTAGYWTRTKLYPNQYWAEFTLTPDGQKLITLQNGGDVMAWRPNSPADQSFTVIATTVATNHLLAINVQDPQDEDIAGATTAKGVDYAEAVNLNGVPGPLSDIAHNPGNQLSVKRHADFSLANGAWKLQAIE